MPSTLRLYELSTEYLQALEALSELDDLPSEAIADTLEGLSGAWEDKALNVARFVRNLEAEATAIEEAKKRMEVRARVTQHKAARLRQYLLGELEKTGLRPKAADVALRVQKNPPAVILDDETRIPEYYRCSQVVTTILKAEIAAALKAGQEIAGAHLEQTQRLVIA